MCYFENMAVSHPAHTLINKVPLGICFMLFPRDTMFCGFTAIIINSAPSTATRRLRVRSIVIVAILMKRRNKEEIKMKWIAHRVPSCGDFAICKSGYVLFK